MIKQLYYSKIHLKILLFIIITSNDNLKPSAIISEQSPTGLIARHIKITGL